MRRLLPLLAFALLVAPLPAPAEDGERLFREQVAPTLERHRPSCHSEKASKDQPTLTTVQGLLNSGFRRPAITPGRPAESLLVEMMSGPSFELFRYKDDPSPVCDHAAAETARDPPPHGLPNACRLVFNPNELLID
jgi:hypothetical protein